MDFVSSLKSDEVSIDVEGPLSDNSVFVDEKVVKDRKAPVFCVEDMVEIEVLGG